MGHPAAAYRCHPPSGCSAGLGRPGARLQSLAGASVNQVEVFNQSYRRHRHRHDGRSIRLHPTEAGHAAHREMHQQRKRLAARLIKGLAADDLAQLKRLLARLTENLETP